MSKEKVSLLPTIQRCEEDQIPAIYKKIKNKSHSEVAKAMNEKCVHLTSNRSEGMTWKESLALSIMQHLTGRYHLDGLDYTKLDTINGGSRVNESAWNAFRIELHTTTKNIFSFVYETLQQLLSDYPTKIDPKTTKVVVITPKHQFFLSNGQPNTTHIVRYLVDCENTVPYEALVPFEELYDDPREMYEDALLPTFESIISSHFEHRFGQFSDTTAIEELATDLRNEIKNVGCTFDTWRKIFVRWQLAERTRVLTSLTDACIESIGEWELCELLRLKVATCFEAASTDAMDKQLKISEHQLHEVSEKHLKSLEEIENLQREVEDVERRSVELNDKISWKKFLMKVSSSDHLLDDYSLALEREKHKLFRINRPIELAHELYKRIYPNGQNQIWNSIQSYMMNNDLTQLLRELRGALITVIGQETKSYERDGVLTVSGQLIALSTVQTPKTNLREIRVEAQRTIYIDVDWKVPGISILLSSPSIISKDYLREINTTGNDAKEFTSSKAADGRTPGENGSPGMDGQDGQNAGHVSIKCRCFSGLLKVVANGGNGACGQSGGNGRDGQAGRDGEDVYVPERVEQSLAMWVYTLLMAIFGFPLVILSIEIITKVWLKLTSPPSGYECMRSYELFNTNGKVEHRASGTSGTAGQNGGSGGNAGRGGRGGRAGDITIDAPGKNGGVNCEAVNGKDGHEGWPGAAGNGGIGGRRGRGAVFSARLERSWFSCYLIWECEASSYSNERNVDGQRGMGGCRPVARTNQQSKALSRAFVTDANTDHWRTASANQLGLEGRHIRVDEQEVGRLNTIRAQAKGAITNIRQRLAHDIKIRSRLSEQVDMHRDARRRMKENNAEILVGRVLVTAKHSVRMNVKPNSDLPIWTTRLTEAGIKSIHSGSLEYRNMISCRNQVDQLSIQEKVRFWRVSQELIVHLRNDKHNWKSIEGFIHQPTDPNTLVGGLKLIADCARFCVERSDTFVDKVLQWHAKLSVLKRKNDIVKFDWTKTGLVADALARLAFDSHLFILVTQRLSRVKSRLNMGSLCLMENVWQRGDVRVSLGRSVVIAPEQDQNQWKIRVCNILFLLEQSPIKVKQTKNVINGLIRYRLGLKEAFEENIKASYNANRDKLMIILEHGSLDVVELDIVVGIAVERNDREMFALAHRTFVERFSHPKLVKISTFLGDRFGQLTRELANFENICHSPSSLAPFAQRLFVIDQLNARLHAKNVNEEEIINWMNSVLKHLEPWLSNTQPEDETNMEQLVDVVAIAWKFYTDYRSPMQLLHLLDNTVLHPEKIKELAKVVLVCTAASSDNSGSAIVRFHRYCFRESFPSFWFGCYIKYWNGSLQRKTIPLRSSLDTFDELEAKLSLWTACLSPTYALEKLNQCASISGIDDKKKFISTELKLACDKLKEIIAKQLKSLNNELSISANTDISALMKFTFNNKTTDESSLIKVMDLVQMYIDLTQDPLKVEQNEISEWNKACSKGRSNDLVSVAHQIFSSLTTAKLDRENFRFQLCKRLVFRRNEILADCEAEIQWMSEFIRHLSNPAFQLNHLSIVTETLRRAQDWNWLEMTYDNQLLHSAIGVFNEITAYCDLASVSWSHLLNRVFAFFCPKASETIRAEPFAALANHVLDRVKQQPNRVEWVVAEQCVRALNWLNELNCSGQTTEAFGSIQNTVTQYCLLCYKAKTVEDLQKRDVQILPEMIHLSYWDAVESYTSVKLFWLRVNNPQIKDEEILRLVSRQHALQFIVGLMSKQSESLYWDEAVVTKFLEAHWNPQLNNAQHWRALPQELSQQKLLRAVERRLILVRSKIIIKHHLSRSESRNRRAFTERWMTMPRCSGSLENIERMNKAYLNSDLKHEEFFTMFGLDVLRDEERAYTTFIANDDLVRKMLASGAVPSTYLASLEKLAIERIRFRLSACFPAVKPPIALLDASIDRLVSLKKDQGELLACLEWLDRVVSPSLESYARNEGPTLEEFAVFLNDASKLSSLTILRDVTLRFSPHHWSCAVAVQFIGRIINQLDIKNQATCITAKLTNWSMNSTLEVTAGVLRALYIKILEQVATVISIVDSLLEINPAKIDVQSVKRFAKSTLDDWLVVIRLAQFSAKWKPDVAIRLDSFVVPVFDRKAATKFLFELEKLLDTDKEAQEKLSNALNNLYKYPWLKDDLVAWMPLSESTKIGLWLDEASNSRKVEIKAHEAGKQELNIGEILNILKNDPLSASLFPEESLNCISERVQAIWSEYDAKTHKFTHEEVHEWAEQAKTNQSPWTLVDFLAVACRAVELEKNYRPRNVQLVAAFAFLFSTEKSDAKTIRRMAQVSTGEGKTLITAIVAIYHVLRHWNTRDRRTDVVTSSSVLAEANVAEIKWLYDAFDVKVTNNCDATCSVDDNLKRERYNSDVIYGDLGNFMRDVLVTCYFDYDITRNTAPGAIVIDEVDSMLLDKGENVLYISHNLPEMYDLLNVFVHIWAAVNGPDITEPVVIEEFIRPKISQLVPRFLVSFCELHLSTWVGNALRARFLLEPNDAYKVDDVKDGRGKQIVIMDKETGVEQLQTEWTDGLQQFLQLKHGVKWTPPSLRAFFMSNMTYFSKFKGKIYGLTGTLGSQAECQLLTDLYEVKFFRLPRAKRRFCAREKPIIVNERSQWLNNITNQVNETVLNHRAALVLCENIKVANLVRGQLHKAHIASECYVSSLDEGFKERQQKDLIPGDVIIATNLAGRGTDLKLDQTLVKNGGLHVIITFLPANARIENQAQGRTARAGQPGSYQFVVMSSEPKIDPIVSLCKLKQKRDTDESERLARLRDQTVPKTELEHQLFQRFFSECCQKFTSSSNLDGKFVRKCLTNRWAMWLDENEKLIDDASNTQTKVQIMQRFERFLIETNAKRAQPRLLASMPSELISLARTVGNSSATILYEEVRRNEPGWCENALLELSRVLLADKAGHDKKKEARPHLKHARQLIEKRIENLTGCAQIVAECLSKQANKANQATGFADQMSNLISLWNVHSSAVDRLLGVPLEQALNNYFDEDKVGDVLAFLAKSSYIRRFSGSENPISHYSKKITIRQSERSHQNEIFIETALGEEHIAWPPFVSHCRTSLMGAIQNALNGQSTNVFSMYGLKTIERIECEFWERLIHEGFVDKFPIKESSMRLRKNATSVDADTLPKELKNFEKILADWLQRHEGEVLDTACLTTTGLPDSLHEYLRAWLIEKGMVETLAGQNHKILKKIPSIEENPEAMIGPYPLVEWGSVLAAWFTGNVQYVSLPDFEGRARKLEGDYVKYLVDLRIAKPPSVVFRFFRRDREEIQKQLKKIEDSFNSLEEIESLTSSVYGSYSEDKRAMLIDNLMAAVREHIGQLKLFEKMKSSYCELKTIVSNPDDPVFGKRDECDEMESRHLERIVRVEEKVSRWNWKLGVVALIGMAQLVGAVLFPFFSSGLIGEGINDLTYAFQCLCSPGSFSWREYAKQKMVSLAITAMTLGVAAARLVSATGGGLRSAAQLMLRARGGIASLIQAGKAVIKKCLDVIVSSVIGRCVHKFLNWLKSIILEKVLERVKSFIFRFFKSPFEKMKDLLRKMIRQLVTGGVHLTDAIEKVKQMLEGNNQEQQSWLAAIADGASRLVGKMKDMFSSSTQALGDLQSCVSDSYATNAVSANAKGIADAVDGGSIAKAIKIGAVAIDYTEKAMELKKQIDELVIVKNLCKHAASRIENQNEQLRKELIQLKQESNNLKNAHVQSLNSQDEKEIDRFVNEVPGEMQTEIMQHVLNTIQAVWVEPHVQEEVQKKVDRVMNKMATHIGLMPPLLPSVPDVSRPSQERQTADYEQFLEKIGQGEKAGPVEVQNAADALNVNIKINDMTGDYTKGSDDNSSSFTYYAQGNPYSKANTAIIEFTANADGSKHMTFVMPDGTRHEHTPDPNEPPNRCLYDALAKATGKTTGDTVKACKDYAKTNERARYMHDIRVDIAYSHLRTGKQNNSKKKTESDFDDIQYLDEKTSSTNTIMKLEKGNGVLKTDFSNSDKKEIDELIDKWSHDKFSSFSRNNTGNTLSSTKRWRIDLQSLHADSTPYLQPDGKWANIQIQYGGREYRHQRSRGESTTVAEVHVQTDQNFTIAEFQEAFRQSMKTERRIFMYKGTPRTETKLTAESQKGKGFKKRGR